MTTNFPEALDGYPQFILSTEEHSSAWWNDLRDALEAIEGSLGVDPQGEQADLSTRINKNFAGNGGLLHVQVGHNIGLATGFVILFPTAFTQIPHVFVSVNHLGLGNQVASNEAHVLAVGSVSTTQFTVYGRRMQNSAPVGNTEVAWMAWAREEVSPSIYRIGGGESGEDDPGSGFSDGFSSGYGT